MTLYGIDTIRYYRDRDGWYFVTLYHGEQIIANASGIRIPFEIERHNFPLGLATSIRGGTLQQPIWIDGHPEITSDNIETEVLA